jgi:hypothetical protein
MNILSGFRVTDSGYSSHEESLATSSGMYLTDEDEKLLELL